jgi:hypothetical protein
VSEPEAELLDERDDLQVENLRLHVENLRLQAELARYRKWYYGPRGDAFSLKATWRRCC